MLSIHENGTLEEAGKELLSFILQPRHWVALGQVATAPGSKPGENASYQRNVGAIRICASVDVTAELAVFLRVAFRAPGLTPLRAADHLEAFFKQTLPLRANTEWQVHVDGRKWIHFIRRWSAPPLEG